jgi:hypothetical protein
MVAVLLAIAPAALAQQEAQTDPDAQPAPAEQQQAPPTGGAEFGEDPSPTPRPVVPGATAVLMEDGFAAAPADAPPQVQAAIWAGNEIQGKPYKYGGGHAKLIDSGYDCSGTVSFALNAAELLRRPRDSGSFMRYGASGPGKWITIYTNPGHAYVIIAGLRLDTSSAGDRVSRGKGPRWRSTARAMRGFKVRHPIGY